MTTPYDSILIVSFGGPEGPADVVPFLERVTQGRGVPRERLEEVAEHYMHFGGVSPINAQNRDLIEHLKRSLADAGVTLPIYFGNRNWHPFLTDTLREMANDGRKRALAFFTSMFSSYSGCRQYRENIEAARAEVGPDAPVAEKTRFGFNHPGFVGAMADRVNEAREKLNGSDSDTTLIFTAHSIPLAMANNCAYERQLREACRLVATEAGFTEFTLAWQSRSGSPMVPWLEPDVNDVLRTLVDGPKKNVVISPIGFISDHIEVLFDLDEEAKETATELGLRMERAGTVGTHSKFVQGVTELILERVNNLPERVAMGELPAWHDVCPVDCCKSGYAPRPNPTPTAEQTL